MKYVGRVVIKMYRIRTGVEGRRWEEWQDLGRRGGAFGGGQIRGRMVTVDKAAREAKANG